MKTTKYIILPILLCGLLYTLVWYAGAYYIDRYLRSYIALQADANIKFTTMPTYPSGFPGKYSVSYSGEIITPLERIEIRNMTVRGWPLPGQLITLTAMDGFNIQSPLIHKELQEISYFDMAFTVPHGIPSLWVEPYLRQWQADGNAITTIENLHINWLGMAASGAGQLELNKDLQPEAKGEIYIRNYKEFLSRISVAYNLSPQQTQLILSLLSSQEDPETGQITLPVNIKNRKVYLYMFPLVTLPHIKWPQLPDKQTHPNLLK